MSMTECFVVTVIKFDLAKFDHFKYNLVKFDHFKYDLVEFGL